MDLFTEKFPKTVDQAVDRLINELSFRDKTIIANMNDQQLVTFHNSYGIFLRTEFRLPGNDPLMASCCKLSDLNKVSSKQASYIILKELQRKLKKTNVLIRVK